MDRFKKKNVTEERVAEERATEERITKERVAEERIAEEGTTEDRTNKTKSIHTAEKEQEGRTGNRTLDESEEQQITCYDAYGRKMLITKSQWVEKVLPDQLQKHWEMPTNLYNDILYAVNDGLTEYVVEAAQHLQKIDTIKERGYVILAIVYMKVKRNAEAQEILEEYIEKYGKTGTVLTNLAKTLEEQGRHEECLATLWEGLQLDPNQDNGLAWFLAIKKEEGGMAAYVQALQEISKIPGSYRASLYIARNYGNNKDHKTALMIYQQLVKEYGDKEDVLFQISGDMGQAGLVKEMIDLIEPLYDYTKNDERIGMNLLQAYLMTHNVQKGKELLSSLMKTNRVDLRQYLMQLSSKFEALEEQLQDQKEDNMQTMPKMETCGLEKPIWQYNLGDLRMLGSVDQEHATERIGVIVYSNAEEGKEKVAHSEKETNLGRLTRSLPLFLNELFYYYTEYKTITLVPVFPGIGPVLSGGEWSKEVLLSMAKSNGLIWLLTGNISADEEYLYIKTAIVNAAKEEVEKITKQIHLKEMGNSLMEHVEEVFAYITKQRLCDQSDSRYEVPKNENLMEYLSSLGQSLMQTLIVNEIVPFNKMYGERNILNDYIMDCLHMPSLPQVPLLLASGLSKSKLYGSTVYMEFKQQAITAIREFAKEKPQYEEVLTFIERL
ncbi:tetratricopeptide repeat protein [Anaerosporobacter faecicola]|uniref:tetratricopeptide repeat protein n=1 Tax=Anaerosporobacter faecicola TaxID=2718714 RepID=UPI001438E557|nr:tetratricopeptide repeat protein [Anaerosporobacter faecicola]